MSNDLDATIKAQQVAQRAREAAERERQARIPTVRTLSAALNDFRNTLRENYNFRQRTEPSQSERECMRGAVADAFVGLAQRLNAEGEEYRLDTEASFQGPEWSLAQEFYQLGRQGQRGCLIERLEQLEGTTPEFQAEVWHRVGAFTESILEHSEAIWGVPLFGRHARRPTQEIREGDAGNPEMKAGQTEGADAIEDQHKIDPTMLPFLQIASDVPDLGAANTVPEFWQWCNRNRESLRQFRMRLGEPEPAAVATDEFRVIPEIVRQCRSYLLGFGAECIPDRFTFSGLPQVQTPTGPEHFPSPMEHFLVWASAYRAGGHGLMKLIGEVEDYLSWAMRWCRAEEVRQTRNSITGQSPTEGEDAHLVDPLPDYPHRFPLVAERDPQKARVNATGRALDFRQAEMVSLGFAWDWWLPLELARKWQSMVYPAVRTPEAVSQWLAYMHECVSCANLGHALRPASGRLEEQIDVDVGLLRSMDPSLTNPGKTSLMQQEGELPTYRPEEQPWFTALPKERSLAYEELAPTERNFQLVIMTAVEIERDAVLRRLTPLSGRKRIIRTHVEQETYFLGRFGTYPAAVTMCAMGSASRDAAILATEAAIDLWKPVAVIMTGIAFGADEEKQAIADVLIATQIIPYENQRVGPLRVHRAAHPESGAVLLNRFKNVRWEFKRPDNSLCERRYGPLLSGEKLIDDLNFKAELLQEFPKAIGGEMEGYGVQAASARKKVEWIVVKAICDWGDGKKHGKHQALAAAAAASLACQVLADSSALAGLKK
jgi:nucleoside phosphorylase